MCGGKCGSKRRLCSFTLGLAVGLTAAVLVFIFAAMGMFWGPDHLAGFHLAALAATWGDALVLALYALLHGFIFGFLVGLFYNLIACCCRCSACHGKSCGCGAGACACGTKEGKACGCGCGCKGCSCQATPGNTDKPAV